MRRSSSRDRLPGGTIRPSRIVADGASRVANGPWQIVADAPRFARVAASVVVAVATVAAVSVTLGAGGSTAAPAPTPGTPASIMASRDLPDGLREVTVRSPAMRAPMTVMVIPSRVSRGPHPTLYLLNGAQGGTNGSSWLDQTDVIKHFADKDVTVVVPLGGSASYFADWRRDDPGLGRQKWATYLTRELPPLMDSAFGGNGRNAIAGISMAGTSVLQLAIDAPGLYRAVGAYSGCASTSDPLGEAYVRLTIARGGGNADNLWGPPGDPAWVRNDPYVNAAKLRGTALFISSGTGRAGPYERIDGPGIDGNAGELIARIGVGAVIESSTRQCTLALKSRLAALSIPATFSSPPVGTHSWPYWQDALHESWPLFAKAFAR